MQDPFLLFGVHSSLVSGKIAGIAIDDKAEAYDLFRKMTSAIKVSWAAKQVFSLQPHWLKRPAVGLYFDILARFTLQPLDGGSLEDGAGVPEDLTDLLIQEAHMAKRKRR